MPGPARDPRSCLIRHTCAASGTTASSSAAPASPNWSHDPACAHPPPRPLSGPRHACRSPRPRTPERSRPRFHRHRLRRRRIRAGGRLRGFAESVAELPAVAVGRHRRRREKRSSPRSPLRPTRPRCGRRAVASCGCSEMPESPMTPRPSRSSAVRTPSRALTATAIRTGGTYRSDRLDLTALPHLRELPDVESGSVRNGTATVTLAEGTDLHTWVEDAVTRDGHSRVHAYPAEDDSQETGGPRRHPWGRRRNGRADSRRLRCRQLGGRHA